MKKGKLLLSILAAAVFATVSGTLVACKEGLDLPDNGKNKPITVPDTGKEYTVTFNPNGGTLSGSATLKTNKDGIVQGATPTATKGTDTFNGWALTQSGTTAINFATKKFTDDTTVYAWFTPKGNPGPGPVVEDGYTITFLDGDHGTVNGNNVLTTDKDGKVTFPTVTAENGWELDYWDVKGEKLYEDFDNYVFTENTNVTAYYKETGNNDNPDIDDATYYLIGSITDWGVNADEMYTFEKIKDSDDGKDQYLLTVELQTNDKVKIVKGNKEQWISSWEGGWSFADIDDSDSEDNGNLIIKEDGTYDIYLKVNKDDGNDTSVWVSKQGGGNNDDPDVDSNTYYLIGTMTDWAVKTDAKYVFTKTKDSDDGKDQYLLNISLNQNDKVKIVLGNKSQWIGSWEGGWDYAEADGEENLVIGSSASYDFYLKVNKDDANDTSVWVSKQGGSGEADNSDNGESNFYLFGTINGQDCWGVSKGGIKFIETELNINEDSTTVIAHKYKVEVDLVARDKVKIFRTNVENSWDYSYFEAGSLGTNVVVSDTDLTVMTAGHYTFYLREYFDTSVGSNGYTVRVFFVAPAPATTATAKINNINIPETEVDITAPGHATLVKWYKATGVQIADNTKIKFYVDGKVISVLMRAARGTIIDGAENMAEEFTVTKGDKFEIHIKYYSDDGWKVWMNGEHDYSQTNPTPNADANAYYLVGTMTGWDINPDTTYKLTPKANENDSRTQYMLTIKLNKDDLVKIVKGDGSEWIGAWQQNWDYGVKDGDDNLEIQQNGTYEFYLKLAKDDMPTEIWVSQQSASGGNQGGDGGQDDGNMVNIVNGNQADNKPNVYVIKKGNMSKGYFATYTGTNGDGYDEYSVTVTLNEGDEVAMYVPTWGDDGNGWECSTLNPYSNDGVEESNGYIRVKRSGTYTFYFQTKWGDDRVYVGAA